MITSNIIWAIILSQLEMRGSWAVGMNSANLKEKVGKNTAFEVTWELLCVSEQGCPGNM